MPAPAPPESVRLRDGSRVTIRPVAATDEPDLFAFLAQLCAHARYLRFFSGAADMRGAARLAVRTDAGRCGLVAHDEAGTLVGHALYVLLGDPGRAEVAVEVADRLHGLGLGTILIERLAGAAERNGVQELVAEVLPQNKAMLDVFRDGFDAQVRLRDGVDTVTFPTSAWRTASARFPAAPPR